MNNGENKFYRTKTYYALTTDPIHVGTGSYRLAGVDLSIVRDPATRLPKIPGSSLSGVARSNAAMRLQDNPFDCAGKGGDRGEKHCGELDCAICNTFGYSKGDSDSLQGMAQFFDAQIFLFPVYSMYGTVWMTSETLVRESGFEPTPKLAIEQVALSTNFAAKSTQPERINLGWLLLDAVRPALDGRQVLAALFGKAATAAEVKRRTEAVANRLVIVHDNLFSRLVNDNLEVRTSVSINPQTGAAEEGALFTYEAIPRATFMRFDVVCNNPEMFRESGILLSKKLKNKVRFSKKPQRFLEENNKMNLEDVITVVETGLEDFAMLGVGGMNTRGMGRLAVLNLTAE
jgi:CRISPR-associated protein Cmr4